MSDNCDNTRSKEQVMPNELSREQFIAQLIKAGWRKDEAEAEWASIQADEESGYDGP